MLHFYLRQNLVLIKKITEYETTYFTYGTMVNVNTDDTHTKTLDGFLGKLPTSWMEKVKPTGSGASNWSKKGKDKDAEADIQVTNTNWNPSLKKHWEASGFTMLHDMLKKKPDNVDILKMGDKTACLSWLVKGRCFSTCPHKDLHKQANGALVDATHKLLDACGVPMSN